MSEDIVSYEAVARQTFARYATPPSSGHVQFTPEFSRGWAVGLEVSMKLGDRTVIWVHRGGGYCTLKEWPVLLQEQTNER